MSAIVQTIIVCDVCGKPVELDKDAGTLPQFPGDDAAYHAHYVCLFKVLEPIHCEGRFHYEWGGFDLPERATKVAHPPPARPTMPKPGEPETAVDPVVQEFRDSVDAYLKTPTSATNVKMLNSLLAVVMGERKDDPNSSPLDNDGSTPYFEEDALGPPTMIVDVLGESVPQSSSDPVEILHNLEMAMDGYRRVACLDTGTELANAISRAARELPAPGFWGTRPAR